MDVSSLRQRLVDIEGITLAGVLHFDPRLRSVSKELFEVIQRERAAGIQQIGRENIADWANLLCAGTVRYMTEQFQYLDLRSSQLSALTNLYRQFAGAFLYAAYGPEMPDIAILESILGDHHDRLRAWLAARLVEVDAHERVESTGLRPVCAQYSAVLQLAILGLDSGALEVPVLDLGCGADGRLVAHLTACGVDATGVDQNAPGTPTLMRANWFDAPLQPERWGTIVAHQSVSLHFINAHLHSPERAADYARLFLRIVSALKPGGSFVYAPAVPFFETHLPVVRRDSVGVHLGASHIRKTARGLELSHIPLPGTPS